MLLEMDDLSTILNKKTSKAIIWFIISLSILISIFVVIMIKYEYYQYNDYLGYIGYDEDYYMTVYLTDDTITVFQNGFLSIDNKEYNYEEIIISDEYYLVDNYKYRLVKLKGKMDSKYLIINNVINVQLKHSPTTMLKQIKKGLKLWN